MEGRTNGRINEQTNGLTDERANGQTRADERTKEQTEGENSLESPFLATDSQYDRLTACNLRQTEPTAFIHLRAVLPMQHFPQGRTMAMNA